MSATLSQFLVDTLVYTGLLIVLVMAMRGPVARWFGPQVAYALWALPLLRLLMPPLQLPASMAPAAPVAAEPVLLLAQESPLLPTYETASPLLTIADVLPALWLIGALLFLGWRLRQYSAMRTSFLADARPVGEAGRVRLVETPAADLPLAFGIRDKVVALPPGFMAYHDRAARDLAIAHELAHHRGHDLLANLAAQLLLALHWFNPLAWIGWRAMRKDQEAACDARVVAGRERADRIIYAEVIAGFAAGDRLSLSAPLACPIASFGLGEKSIIHRLRTLTMSEVPTARRRLGLASILAGVLALPLTASISYAQPEVADAPAAPRMERRIVIVDVPAGAAMDDPDLHTQHVERADGTTVILRTSRPVSPEEARDRVETAIASMPDPPAPPTPPAAPGAPQAAGPGVRQFVLRREGHPPAADAAEAGDGVTVRRFSLIDRSVDGHRVEIITNCDADGDEAAEAECRAEVHAQALADHSAARAEAQAGRAEAVAEAALQRARAAIAGAPMPEEARLEALRELDREIAEMRERQEVSYAAPMPAKVVRQQTLTRVTFQLGLGRTSLARSKSPDQAVPGRLV